MILQVFYKYLDSYKRDIESIKTNFRFSAQITFCAPMHVYTRYMIENAQSGSQSLNSSNNTFYTDYYTTSFSEQLVVEEEFMICRANKCYLPTL